MAVAPVVPAGGVKRGETRLITSATWSSDPPMVARTRAWLPSALRSGGGEPRVQYEVAWVTPVWAASSLVRATPAAAACALSTDPSVEVTSRTRFGVRCPKAASSVRRAWLDSAPGSPNPPTGEVLGHPAPDRAGHDHRHQGGDQHG